MRICNFEVQSEKIFSFGFKGLVTDFIYFASYFKPTNMVVIFKIHFLGIGSEQITIDRWITESQFQKMSEDGYIEVETKEDGLIYSDTNEEQLFTAVLKRYAERFPILC